jgi:hypothetical protein
MKEVKPGERLLVKVDEIIRRYSALGVSGRPQGPGD